MTRRELLLALGAAAASGRVSLTAPQSRSTDETTWLDAAALRARIVSGAMSARDVADAFLRRIERVNPTLGAYVTVTSERARADAARVDEALRAKQPLGRLAGVPIVHKDLFETAGIRTTAGSRLFEHYIPQQDATIVARLAAAGTVLLGKSNTHELGGGVTTINPFFGTTRNPWNHERIPGGSSGGSAAAVAGGLAAAATGSDTGGSIRVPAAFCGCVGFKPTFGRISTAGLLGAAPTFDHSGLLTRTVADARLLYRETAGLDRRDPSTVPIAEATPASAAPLRVGVARHFFFERLQPDVANAVEAAINIFRKSGAEVGDITFPISNDTMATVFDPIGVAEIHQHFARDWRERPGAFSPSFAEFFKAPVPSAFELVAAQRALRAYQADVRRLFEDVDVVITPTVPVTAPLIVGPIDGTSILRNTLPFNAARTPALSVPCGFDADGLPVGLQLVAAPYADEIVLRAGETFQRLTQWHLRRPHSGE